MNSRRDFLKKAAFLGAGYAWAGGFPASIQRALAIDPALGTTYRDAEHVVILMQENRSFDHCYGSLRGVRGFHDPRAVSLPNSNPVWLQTNANNETYAPYRLDLKDSKITWMGSLPHSWSDQVAARNGGKHDQWLVAKPSGHKEYAHLPLTLGYYTRDDLPFYYALADAFTVCDQNFCSSLTGTTPNRLYLWTGTIREKPSQESKPNVWNSDVDYGSEAHWKTFPERLEDAGVSWGIYQNELSLNTGLSREEEGWLANFTDNPIEWFSQYAVRFSPSHRRHLPAIEKHLVESLATLEKLPSPSAADLRKRDSLRAQLARARSDLARYHDQAWAELDERTRRLHSKAFITNQGDPAYRELTTLPYQEDAEERQMKVPKGDVLFQFRKDVREGKLPAVSWIVAPENFSDHPGAPWFGAWYLSEVMDILTHDPKVWQKTIFILCYDENDGLFDHIPPFVPPPPGQSHSGAVSQGLDTSVEMGLNNATGTPQPIGLGYRVPLVIASPWSRGGLVCSEVFDHTSILQFLEHWLTLKTGKSIHETNISSWRRTICGDLTSAFRPYHGEPGGFPEPVARKAFFQSIHQAQFKPVPKGHRLLSEADCLQAREGISRPSWLPRQESGTRPACALPYELRLDGQYSKSKSSLVVSMTAEKNLFGDKAAGTPFHCYAPGWTRLNLADSKSEAGRTWSFAVAPGLPVRYEWPLSWFENETYHLRFHGPNGFYRELKGSAADPELTLTWNIVSRGQWRAELQIQNRSGKPVELLIHDRSYGHPPVQEVIPASPSGSQGHVITMDLQKSHGWYDLHITAAGHPGFERRYAGHIEVGLESISDPAMG